MNTDKVIVISIWHKNSKELEPLEDPNALDVEIMDLIITQSLTFIIFI